MQNTEMCEWGAGDPLIECGDEAVGFFRQDTPVGMSIVHLCADHCKEARR